VAVIVDAGRLKDGTQLTFRLTTEEERDERLLRRSRVSAIRAGRFCVHSLRLHAMAAALRSRIPFTATPRISWA
jgi:hypothetical protein